MVLDDLYLSSFFVMFPSWGAVWFDWPRGCWYDLVLYTWLPALLHKDNCTRQWIIVSNVSIHLYSNKWNSVCAHLRAICPLRFTYKLSSSPCHFYHLLRRHSSPRSLLFSFPLLFIIDHTFWGRYNRHRMYLNAAITPTIVPLLNDILAATIAPASAIGKLSGTITRASARQTSKGSEYRSVWLRHCSNFQQRYRRSIGILLDSKHYARCKSYPYLWRFKQDFIIKNICYAYSCAISDHACVWIQLSVFGWLPGSCITVLRSAVISLSLIGGRSHFITPSYLQWLGTTVSSGLIARKNPWVSKEAYAFIPDSWYSASE